MRPLPELPVFSSADAAERGWSRSALRNAVARGRVVRLRRDIYTCAARSTPTQAAVAAARAYPAAAISHRSAVLVHDLPLLGPRPAVPELTVPPRSNANFHDAHPYRAALRDSEIVTTAGARVTSVARTLVDLGRHRPLQTAVVAIDAALNRRLVTPAEIEDVLRCCWNWPMIRRAQLAVRRSDGRAESPLESISRLVFQHLRLPIPEVHKPIFDQGGVLVADTDFYWDEFGVVGEADGRDKYDARDVLSLEKERQELLEQLGLVVVRWGWDDAYARPYRLRSRLNSGFERGQLRDRSGFPRLWSL